MSIVIIFNLIIWSFLLYKKQHTFLWLPLIVLLSQFLIPFITDVNTTINFAPNKAYSIFVYSILLFKLVVTASCLYDRKSKAIRKDIFGIYSLLIFLVFIIPITASEPDESFRRVLMFASDMLFLPASYFYFTKNGTKHFNLAFYCALTLATIYVIYASVYQIGFTYYGNPILFYGGFHMFGLYLFVYATPLLLLNYFTNRESKKYLSILFVAVGFIFVLLTFKRTLIILFIMFLLAFVVRTIKSKRSIFGASIAIIFLFATSFLFQEDISSRFETRERALSNQNIEQQGRFIEYKIAFDELFGNVSYMTLIGKDVFNDKGKFGQENSYGLKIEDRYLHSDYVKILYTGGLIGILLLIRIWIKLFSINSRFERSKYSNPMVSFTIKVILVGLVINYFIDGIFIFFARAWPFYLLGYLFAVRKINYERANE